VSPVKYEMAFYIPDDDILHSHRRVNLKLYRVRFGFRAEFYSTYEQDCPNGTIVANPSVLR
jgi:hypothetical protein